MIETGTRQRQTAVSNRTPGGSVTRSLSTDKGMKLRVATSLTFGSGRATGSNGDFTGFAGNEIVMVEGTNANNGYFTVTGIDGTNHAYVTLDPAPKSEGPVAAVLRTA